MNTNITQKKNINEQQHDTTMRCRGAPIEHNKQVMQQCDKKGMQAKSKQLTLIKHNKKLTLNLKHIKHFPYL